MVNERMGVRFELESIHGKTRGHISLPVGTKQDDIRLNIYSFCEVKRGEVLLLKACVC
ncbi:hypothetical protein OCA41_05800 [Bacillus cereus]|nr:hypothetical protein [Bacillus cereus]